MALVPQDRIDEIEAAFKSAGLNYMMFRDDMLSGINPGATGLMPIFAVPFLQLSSDLAWCNRNERLADGSIPLELWLKRAAKNTAHLPIGAKFRQWVDDIGGMANGQPAVPTTAVDDVKKRAQIKELVLGENDLMPISFLVAGAEARKSVVRLAVPKLVNGVPAQTEQGVAVVFNGSGWLVTPDLLVTNHHVVNAREDGKPGADLADLERQCLSATIRFDFDSEGQAGDELKGARLEAFSPLNKLDYAILRLAAPSTRPGLELRPDAVKVDVAVNIIQHPDGGPKRVALRNNLVTASTESDLQYVTDTKGGSSGSPVFDDLWRVTALHRGARSVEGVKFQGKSTAFVNIGTQIQAILADLRATKPTLAAEIGPKTLAVGGG
jgi:hypothetical protein